MKKPTIYEIKRRTAETAPYFFERGSMKFWGQTLKDFKVERTAEPNKFFIWAKSEKCGVTRRIFNAITNELELV